LVAAAFHLAVSERIVDRAIALEEQAQDEQHTLTGSAAEEQPEPVFSRRTQKVGLVAGLVLYGLTAGMVFGGAYALLARRLPGRSRRAQVLALAGIVMVAVVLVPFLKYPANPPGVGDPETLGRRQLLYVACVLLAAAGLWLAARGVVLLRARGWRPVAAVAAGAVFFALWTGAAFLLLPGRGDPVSVPAGLVWQFRTASLAGQVLFWLAFAAVFAVVVERADAQTAGGP
jgi:predicted cobalt transporter CbtA